MNLSVAWYISQNNQLILVTNETDGALSTLIREPRAENRVDIDASKPII